MVGSPFKKRTALIAQCPFNSETTCTPLIYSMKNITIGAALFKHNVCKYSNKDVGKHTTELINAEKGNHGVSSLIFRFPEGMRSLNVEIINMDTVKRALTQHTNGYGLYRRL